MEVKAPTWDAASALVPFYILQFIFKLPGNVANAPQRAGLAVLVQEVRFFGREVAFHPTDAPSMRRTLYKSIGPSPDVGPVEVPVRRRTIRFIFRFRGDLGLVLGDNSFYIIFKHVAFFFTFFILRIGVGRSLSPTREEPVS